MASVVQIVTEEEYIELLGTESNGETFYGDWSEIGLESAKCKGDNIGRECSS